jgi:hypothetical protein
LLVLLVLVHITPSPNKNTTSIWKERKLTVI